MMDQYETLIEALELNVKDAQIYWLPYLEYEQESTEEILEVYLR